MWLYYVRRYKSVIRIAIIIVVLIILAVVGTSINRNRKGVVEEEVFAGKTMGTAVKKSLYHNKKEVRDKVNVAIDQRLRDLDNQISVRIVDSEVTTLNRKYSDNSLFALSPNIVEYLKVEMEVANETEGAFSPCIRPLSALWNIEEGEEKIPSDEDIQKQLASIDYHKLTVLDTGVIFGSNSMGIDFGAAGKGIACDEVLKILEESEIDSAVVSVGGSSVVTYGEKYDGKPWFVGVRDPRGDIDDVIATIKCGSKEFISTSGDYEKYFEKDGVRYHHILDPKTGYPVDNNLMSVTVVCDSGILSDVMSTACFVLGVEDGLEYAKSKGVEAVFVTKDKEIYVTPKLKKRFHIKENDYTLVK